MCPCELSDVHPDRGDQRGDRAGEARSACRAGSTCAYRSLLWGLDASGSFWADSINVVGGSPAAAAYGDGGGPLMPIGISGLRGMSWEVWEAKTPMVVESCGLRAGLRRRGPLPRRPRDRLRCDRAARHGANGRQRALPGSAVRSSPEEAGGGVTRYSCIPPTAPVEQHTKVTGLHIPAGSRIEVRTGGGAGYGPPEQRSAGDVYADIDAGYLTEAGARAQYPHASLRGGTVWRRASVSTSAGPSPT